MKNKKIVVTGGAGFIGSNLVRKLYQDNEVIIIDNLSTGKHENMEDFIDDIKFVKGDILDIDLLKKTFNEADYVFHEAAVVSVSKSIKDPAFTNNVNINGTLMVIMAAKEIGVKKIVFASSSAVYGDQKKLPINEETQLNPLSPYATSKIAGEYLCEEINDLGILQTVALRYFNVFGPFQDPKGDYAAVIPKFIDNIINGQPLTIYGDGSQTRDFIYVDDVVNANIFAAEKNITGNYNIASGNSISVNQLAEILLKVSNKQNKILYDKPRPGDILHSQADITKIKKAGFELSYYIDKGLKNTYEWFQEKN